MRARHSAVAAAVLMTLMGGCTEGSASGAESGTRDTGDPWHEQIEPARSGVALGGRDSACALPVIFELAADWKPKPVRTDGSEWDELAKQGGATMRCEADAKPAGHIGFLRVWTVDEAGGTPRQALEQFLAGEKHLSDQQHREAKVGALPAAEVTYVRESSFTGDRKRERVLAVAAPRQIVLLSLSGVDTEEYEDMLPAYLLAKRTLAPTA